MKLSYKITVVAALAVGLINLAAPGLASAAESASFSLSPSSGSKSKDSSFSVSVYENSGSESVNSVQLDLTYDQTKLQFTGFSAASPFSCPVTSAGTGSLSIGCAIFGSSVTGNRLVGALGFKALTGSGMAVVNFTQTSLIVRTDAVDIWNHASVSASYTLSTPAPAKPKTTTKATTLGATTPTPAPAPAAADSTTKTAPVVTPVTVAKVAVKDSEKTPAWQWITSLVVVALIAGGLYLRSVENSKISKTLKKVTSKAKVKK